jgi:hypothetical protein
MKRHWIRFKSQFWALLLVLLMGFLLGKVYTWEAIINDCKVLNGFRIAKTAFTCKMMVP